jgi:hypothetical protein
MDPEHADYGEHEPRRRRPWTLIQIAILIGIVLLSLPIAAIVLLVLAFLLLGGVRH